MDNKYLQGKNFKYLDCQISYEYENELAKPSQVLGILNNTFKPNLVHKSSTIKVLFALAVPILLYRSKIWNIRKKKDKKQLTSIEMKFFRRKVGYMLFDHIGNVYSYGVWDP